MDGVNQNLDSTTIAIIRELGIASNLIGLGLSRLRKASFVDHSDFGSSFFNLSIGIERLCKIILIRQFQRKNNGHFPDNEYIKSFSHSISTLIEEISSDYQLRYINNDFLLNKIIKFLTTFAKSTRYYNLDTITGQKLRDKDPYLSWYEIQCEIINRIKGKKLLDSNHKLAISNLEDITYVRHIGMNSESIDTLEKLYTKLEQSNKVQSYAVYYFYQIIFDLVSVSSQERQMFNKPPNIDEFFVLFVNEPMKKAEILRKKDWTRFT